MSGVKGKSGAPGREKSSEHKQAIAAGVQDFWNSDGGKSLKDDRREQRRLARLQERLDRAEKRRLEILEELENRNGR